MTTRIRTPAGSRIDRGAHASPHGGTVSGAPRVWLRLEAGALLIGALVAFAGTRQPWWLVPTVVLLPDLAWVGYGGGTRLGASAYNAAHATPLPATVIGAGWWQHRPLVLALGLVWLAHIGLDRLQGYGLTYGDSFHHTHLGTLGPERARQRAPGADPARGHRHAHLTCPPRPPTVPPTSPPGRPILNGDVTRLSHWGPDAEAE